MKSINQTYQTSPNLAKQRAYSRINMLVLCAQLIGWASLITLFHQDIHWLFKIPIAFLFCMMMQGVFSFMHECCHDHGHHLNRKLNWTMGWLASCIFGTTFTLININHEGHHVRNRTRSELVDYILPGESRLKKTFYYYAGVLGGLWLLTFIGGLLIPFLPYKLARKIAIDKENITYTQAFDDFRPRDFGLMRLEFILNILFWAAAIYVMQWEWQNLLILYGCFALSFSSLQWVYHIRTPIDVTEGAYNLRAPKWLRLLFLNFNYNLSHHRNPAHPWQELYAVSNQEETQPLWYRYIHLFAPPTRLPEDVNSIKKTYF